MNKKKTQKKATRGRPPKVTQYVQVGEKVGGRIRKAENYTIEEFVEKVTRHNIELGTICEASLFARIFSWGKIRKEMNKYIKYAINLTRGAIATQIVHLIGKDNFGKKRK